MPMEVYAFSNREDVLKKASSGGGFLAVAKAFFETEVQAPHAVYGVCFDGDLMPVYRRVTALSDCALFCGSKYVRAELGDTYVRVKEDLTSGMLVLFVGTPCFVAGLRKNLAAANVSDEGLYCVDLICHGTPSANYWADYKAWLEKKYKKKLTDYAFRSHAAGKGAYASVARFADERVVSDDLEVGLYNRLFLRHYLFVPGCFACPFASLDRQGDVTLGDFWGIETVMPEFPARHVSEVLVNTHKGMALMARIKDQADAEGYTVAQCHSDDYIKYQNNLQRPADKPADYETFLADYQKGGMDAALKKYVGYTVKGRLGHTVKCMLNRR